MTSLSETEKSEIKRTLRLFFHGLDYLDAKLIKKAFYKDARSYCINAEGVGGMPVDNWDNVIKQIKDNPDHPYNAEKSKKNIVYIDVTGDVASAKVEWIFSEFKFTDYYNLLKIDNRWYIVNKIYHTTQFDK